MWDRLIRYRSEDGEIEYGEPILEDPSADLVELAMKGQLQANVMKGDDFLSLEKANSVSRDVPSIRGIGLNYKSHILETGRQLPKYPTLFMKTGQAVADCNSDIPIPKIAQEQCDYEGELVVVIGRDAKDVPEASALDYVAAYTCGNDISARDWQRDVTKAGPVPQWSFSKSFDKYAPLGPCLVASRLLGDASGLDLRTTVNGEVRQVGNTSDLCHGVKQLVAFCSLGQTLQKGTLIMTGTPGGVGLFMKPPQFLKDGDEVTVEIAQLGRLSNWMVFEK